MAKQELVGEPLKEIKSKYCRDCNCDKYPKDMRKKRMANGKLRPTWHQAFQKKIITSSEYSKFLDSDEDSLDERIEKRFKELIQSDLPKMQKVIEDELKK